MNRILKAFVYIIAPILVLGVCVYFLYWPSDSPYSEARKRDEERGALLLDSARQQFKQEHYGKAQLLLERLRKEYPLALNAREYGLLLSDSILLDSTHNVLERISELLKKAPSTELEKRFTETQLQEEFYKRKLSHDRKQQKTH